MRPFLPYTIEYSPSIVEHLRSLTAGQRALVLAAIQERLLHEPTAENRNRKRMQPNPLAPWELRVGNLRVYYDVLEAFEPTVLVLAIGMKVRDRLRLGRKEFEL